MSELVIRPVEQNDNLTIATIIRIALTEFGANKPGTVFYDDSTDHLFELFQAEPNSAYFIASINGEIIGGAGIFPTEGLPIHTCELVKMYLSKEARGKGFGQKMIAHCLQLAKIKGFDQVYLETMPELKKAVSVYEQLGFGFLDGPMGNSGHKGCDIWMIKSI